MVVVVIICFTAGFPLTDFDPSSMFSSMFGGSFGGGGGGDGFGHGGSSFFSYGYAV